MDTKEISREEAVMFEYIWNFFFGEKGKCRWCSGSGMKWVSSDLTCGDLCEKCKGRGSRE